MDGLFAAFAPLHWWPTLWTLAPFHTKGRFAALDPNKNLFPVFSTLPEFSAFTLLSFEFWVTFVIHQLIREISQDLIILCCYFMKIVHWKLIFLHKIIISFYIFVLILDDVRFNVTLYWLVFVTDISY